MYNLHLLKAVKDTCPLHFRAWLKHLKDFFFANHFTMQMKKEDTIILVLRMRHTVYEIETYFHRKKKEKTFHC